jgi:hypothetical protein
LRIRSFTQNVRRVSYILFSDCRVWTNDPSSIHSSEARIGHENKQYIEVDASILGFSYELSEDKKNYKVLRYGRSPAASGKTEYTIKPGSNLQVTKWQSHGDNMGVMYSVLKHDNAYTVHRRYETPDITAIYSILRLRTGYRIGMVSKPLQQLLPSLSSNGVEAQVSEGFDIGIMMAEIDRSESWEDIQDSYFNDIIELKDRRTLASLGELSKMPCPVRYI